MPETIKTPPEFDLPVTVRISRRARRMALRLDSANGVMNLVVPARASLKKAYQFARDHEGWILETLAALPRPVLIEDGAMIPLLGQDRTVKIIRDPARKLTDVTLRDGFLYVETNQDDPGLRVIRHLKNEARATLGNLATEKCARIGKTISAIQIRDTKSRWGSCGPDGRLSFSWRLIFAPWEAMDYVVAHEVAHLAHMNHGPRFWALCEELCDNYASGKKWMRKNGQELLRYTVSSTL